MNEDQPPPKTITRNDEVFPPDHHQPSGRRRPHNLGDSTGLTGILVLLSISLFYFHFFTFTFHFHCFTGQVVKNIFMQTFTFPKSSFAQKQEQVVKKTCFSAKLSLFKVKPHLHRNLPKPCSFPVESQMIPQRLLPQSPSLHTGQKTGLPNI